MRIVSPPASSLTSPEPSPAALMKYRAVYARCGVIARRSRPSGVASKPMTGESKWKTAPLRAASSA
jgi:hypothetical protein